MFSKSVFVFFYNLKMLVLSITEVLNFLFTTYNYTEKYVSSRHQI